MAGPRATVIGVAPAWVCGDLRREPTAPAGYSRGIRLRCRGSRAGQTGRSPAASASSSQRVARVPCTPAAGTSSRSAPASAAGDARGLRLTRTTSSQTSVGRVDRREAEADPRRAAAWGSRAPRHDRPLVGGGGRAREDRRHMALRPHARAAGRRTRGTSPSPPAAAASCPAYHSAASSGSANGPSEGGMACTRSAGTPTASSRACAGLLLVALVVVGRDEALVAPPDVDRRPVDRLADRLGGQGRDVLEDGDPDPTAGQHHRRAPVQRLGGGQPGDQRLRRLPGPAGRRPLRRRRRECAAPSGRSRAGRGLRRLGALPRPLPLPLPLASGSAGSNQTCSRTGERSARPVTPVAASRASL